MKNLEIGHNYYGVFSNDTTGKKKMIYNGGISWTAVDGDRQMTKECQKTTDKALEYINRASYRVGQ